MIRYKMRDIAVPVADTEQCPCGRSLQILSHIEGRSSQMIRLSNGRYVHSEFFHYLSDALDEVGCGVREFRVVQLRPDAYVMEVVPETELTSETEQSIVKWCHERLGTDIDIEVKSVAALPRDTSGKLRYFVSEIESQSDSSDG